MEQLVYSFIIPVYNRPDEINELLDSITKLEQPKEKIPFEVIIVEDGSTIPCKNIIEKYIEKIDIKYLFREQNSGYCVVPRNEGAEIAKGSILFFLDSDVLLPPQYLIEVDKFLAIEYLDAFGGPDTSHTSFSNLQKAISYTMTSFLTTGGIRNKKKPLKGKYTPRGFNFGIKKNVFLENGKFPMIMPGEDILLGHTLIKNKYKVGLIENAIVYHKRRTNLKKYFKQIFLFGRGRVNLNIKLSATTNIVHWFPTIFTLFSLLFITSSFICGYSIFPLLLYILMIFIDSSIRNKSIIIAAISIVTTFVQHYAYGIGFILEFIKRYILKLDVDKQFIKKNYH